MVLVLNALGLKLPVEFLSSFLKSEFIVTAAVEINGEPG